MFRNQISRRVGGWKLLALATVAAGMTMTPALQAQHHGGGHSGGHSSGQHTSSHHTGVHHAGSQHTGVHHTGGQHTGVHHTGGHQTGVHHTGGHASGAGHPHLHFNPKGPRGNAGYMFRGVAHRHWCFNRYWNGYGRRCFFRRWNCWLYWVPSEGCWYCYYPEDEMFVSCDNLTDENMTEESAQSYDQ